MVPELGNLLETHPYIDGSAWPGIPNATTFPTRHLGSWGCWYREGPLIRWFLLFLALFIELQLLPTALEVKSHKSQWEFWRLWVAGISAVTCHDYPRCPRIFQIPQLAGKLHAARTTRAWPARHVMLQWLAQVLSSCHQFLFWRVGRCRKFDLKVRLERMNIALNHLWNLMDMIRWLISSSSGLALTLWSAWNARWMRTVASNKADGMTLKR